MCCLECCDIWSVASRRRINNDARVEYDAGKKLRRRLLSTLIFSTGVILFGALGFYLVEGRSHPWTFTDALYQSVITVTTVGLTEAHPLDQPGRIFTIILCLLGFVALSYVSAFIAEFLITNEIHGLWREKRMQQRIDQLSGHFVVCGYGRMGREVAYEMLRDGHQVVAIDTNAEKLEAALADGCLTLRGDACDDPVLEAAGVSRAAGIAVVLSDDAKNLLATLSARAFAPTCPIVARADVPSAESKLVKAGASSVLCPHRVGGQRLAQMALRPNVVEFLEISRNDRPDELRLEEIEIAETSELAQQPLGTVDVAPQGRDAGVYVAAVRESHGALHMHPKRDRLLAGGDVIIALGTRRQLEVLSQRAEA